MKAVTAHLDAKSKKFERKVHDIEEGKQNKDKDTLKKDEKNKEATPRENETLLKMEEHD